MYSPRNKKLTVNVSEKLMSKIKGYAAFSNLQIGVFVNRILIDKVKTIEKNEDKLIKLEKKL